MIYGHAAHLLAELGRCAGDPACPGPALISDDDDPSVRYCARHARERLEHPETPLPDC